MATTSYTPTEEQKINHVSKESTVIGEELAETIKNHLGILENGTFNANLVIRDKEMVGRRMRGLLDVVADGAIVPLLHSTLSKNHILKLAALEGDLLSPLLEEHLGITNGYEFMSLSEGDKDRVGRKLLSLLRDISSSALVPLLNCTLNYDQVKKLSSLKGIHNDVNETPSTSLHTAKKEEPNEDMLLNPMKKEEQDDDADIDEQMAAAIEDIPIWIKDQKVGNDGETRETRGGKWIKNRWYRRKKQEEKSCPEEILNGNQPKKIPPFKCKKCEYSCPQKAELIEHLEIVHGWIKKRRGKSRGRGRKNKVKVPELTPAINSVEQNRAYNVKSSEKSLKIKTVTYEYKCKQCSYKTTLESLFKCHIKIHDKRNMEMSNVGDNPDLNRRRKKQLDYEVHTEMTRLRWMRKSKFTRELIDYQSDDKIVLLIESFPNFPDVNELRIYYMVKVMTHDINLAHLVNLQAHHQLT